MCYFLNFNREASKIKGCGLFDEFKYLVYAGTVGVYVQKFIYSIFTLMKIYKYRCLTTVILAVCILINIKIMFANNVFQPMFLIKLNQRHAKKGFRKQRGRIRMIKMTVCSEFVLNILLLGLLHRRN